MRGRPLLLWLLLWTAAATAQPRVSVTVSPQEPRVGDTVTFSLTIEGGRGASVAGDDILAPDASGALASLGRTPSLDATTSINGRTERRLAWVYRAVAPGTARLGPTQVRVDDRVFTTDPVRLTVRAPAPAAPRARPSQLPSEALAVRVEPERRSAVVGQQVIVDVVLYAAPDAQPTETLALGAWSTPGFWREEMESGVSVGRSVRVGGRERVAYPVERLALFPTRAGRLVIAPRRLRVTVIRYSDVDPADPFGSFFSPFRQRRETVVVESPAVEIDVEALPPGAPPSFSGAVGRFAMERRVNPTAVAADEPVQVTVTYSGTANLATLPAPSLDVPTGVDVFGPDDERTADRLGAQLTATRTFTYTLVPTAGGRVVLPALAASYFDPSANRYVTLSSPAVTVRVSGEGALASAPAALALQTRARWQPAAPPLWSLWAALALGAAVPLGALGVQHARQRIRRRHAQREAKAERSRTAPDGGTYAETRQHLRQALATRYGVAFATPVPRVAAALVAAGADAGAAERAAGVLAACERGLYAPGLTGTPSPEALASEARAVLALLGAPATPLRRATLTGAAVLLLGVSGSVHAQPFAHPETLFREGLHLIAEGDTAGAVAAWHGARAAGTAAAVEHNLGVVALAQRDVARARLHLEQAARLAPLDPDARAALAEARQRAGARPPSRAGQVWALATVAGPAVPVGVALALMLGATWLAFRHRRAAVAVGAGAVLAGAWAAAALADAQAARGVTVEAATVREAPSPEAPEKGRLDAATLVILGRTDAGWRHVRATGGVAAPAGWVPAGAVAE